MDTMLGEKVTTEISQTEIWFHSDLATWKPDPIAYADLYDPNDPAQVAAFFASAKVVRKPGRPKAEKTKIPTAIRLSADVVEYFKSTGAGWQSRIDDVLRDWMSRHPLRRLQ